MDETSQVVENGKLLSSLYETRVPTSSTTGQSWEAFALATLARSHYTLRTILGLGRDREVDTAVLLRAMFEHVVTFAWLLVDPVNHFPMLLRSEYDQRIKQRRDLVEFGISGINVDENEIRRSLIDMGPRCAPDVLARTKLANSYWTRCGSVWIWNFRRAYGTLYRLGAVPDLPTETQMRSTT